MTRGIIVLLLNTILLTLFLWIGFKDFTKETLDYFINTLSSFPLFWTLAVIFFTLVPSLIRAQRWKLLLANTNSPITLRDAYLSIMIGYGISGFIAYAGEIAKPFAIKHFSNVSIVRASIVVTLDRIIDFLFLLCTLTITLFLFDYRLIVLFQKSNVAIDAIRYFISVSKVISITVLLLIALIFLFPRILNTYLRIVGFLVPVAIFPKIEKLIIHIKNMDILSKSKKNAISTIAFSLSIWICYVLHSYSLLQGFNIAIPYNISIAESLIFSLASIISLFLSPSGIGSYQYAATQILVLLFSVPYSQAASFALLGFLTTFLGYSILGVLIIIAIIGINQYKMLAKKK